LTSATYNWFSVGGVTPKMMLTMPTISVTFKLPSKLTSPKSRLVGSVSSVISSSPVKPFSVSVSGIILSVASLA